MKGGHCEKAAVGIAASFTHYHNNTCQTLISSYL